MGMDLTGLKSRCQQGCSPFWRRKGKSILLSIQIVGRLQFPVTVAPKSPFPCWLSVEGQPQHREAATFLHLQASNGGLSPSHASSLSSSSPSSPLSAVSWVLHCYEHMRLDCASHITQDNLSILRIPLCHVMYCSHGSQG